MRSWLFSALLFLLFSLFGLVQAQSPIWRNYTSADGLPSSETYHMAEDNNGYLWITTDHGICRFDGVNFKNYSTADGLPFNVVFEVEKDPKGRLWFTGMDGDVFYHQHDQFVPIHLKEAFPAALVNRISVSDDDTLYAITNLQMTYPHLIKMHVPSRTITVNPLPNHADSHMLVIATPNPAVPLPALMISRPKKRPEILSSSGLIQSSLWQGMYWFSNELDRKAIGLNTIRVKRLPDGRMLVAVGNLLAITSQQGLEVKLTLEEPIRGMNLDRSGTPWITTDNGIWKVLISGTTISLGTHYLEGIIANDIFEDREGHLWVTTQNRGLFQIKPDGQFFFPEKPLTRKRVFHLMTLDDQLFVSIPNGGYTLQVLGDTSYQVKPFTKDPEFLVPILGHQNPAVRKRLAGKFVHVFREYLKIPLTQEGNGVLTPANKDFYCTRDNRVIVHAGRGIVCWDFNTPDGQAIRTAMKRKMRLDAIVEMPDSTILLATPSGIFKIPKHYSDSMERVELPFQVVGNRVTDMQVDSQGNLWFTTRGLGVKYWNLATNTFRSWDVSDGINSNFCNAIILENDTSIWVGTNRGFNHIQVSRGDSSYASILPFASIYGALAQEVQDLEFYKGKLAIGTREGLFLADPKQLAAQNFPPKLDLQSMLVNGEPIDYKENHQFSHDQQNLTFQFCAITFEDAEAVVYRYQLEGLDTTWKETPFPEANFTSLDPGNYTFRVQAINKYGQLSEPQYAIPFYIQPHFTQTLGFRIVVALVLGLILYGLVQLIIRDVVRREAVQRQLLVSEQRALKAQMNPHFVFNLMNSIQYFVSQNEKRAAYQYLGKASRLIRKILESARSNFISLEKELENMQLYLEMEKLRFEDGFTFAIEVSPKVAEIQSEIRIPTMIIQPYIENAIWHGIMPKETPGHLDLRFDITDEVLHIEIEDDGIGRERSKAAKRPAPYKGTSTGMQNTANRIELLNRLLKTAMRVEIEDLPDARGTRIHLYIPLQPKP